MIQGIMSKRGQDLVVVLTSIQKVANAAVQHESKRINYQCKNSTLKKAFRNQTLPKIPIENTNLAAERLLLVSENLAILSRALVSSNSDAKFEAPSTKRSVQNLSTKTEEELSERESECDYPVYQLNSSVTSLDLIENVDDLTDSSKVHSVAFVRKRAPVQSVEIEENEDGTEFPSLAEDKAPPQKPKLTQTGKENTVPSSRVGRVAAFGSLGVGLGLGTLAEASRRVVGLSDPNSNLVLSEANAERIVQTLCRVRGAALKIGQMLSIQDETLISPEVSKIFERVRQSADFMPTWQMERVMVSEFGTDWRQKFASFEDQPFAAASIGQVHRAVLPDDRAVAVKIQYPGVAKGIKSDISNLLGLLKVANILPEGLFVDTVVKHMEIELAQECDYLREAECARKMRRLLQSSKNMYVPKVVDNLCGPHVLTSEYIKGLTIDECVDLDQATRNKITEDFMVLLFKELFVFRYMQTDPNWANFLYDPTSGKLGLLDFGATREYRPFFVNNYFKILNAAANEDADTVLEYSVKLGFLTGYESKIMNDAHVESVMILALPFRTDREFDFGNQETTGRMRELIKVMLQHRLCPPPSEVYSLHRKMSGLFLLATKLRANINCYPVWRRVASEFRPHPEEETK